MAEINPLRYREYCYDNDTKLYIVDIGSGGGADGGAAGFCGSQLSAVLPREVPRLGIVPVGGISDGIIADGMVVVGGQQVEPFDVPQLQPG